MSRPLGNCGSARRARRLDAAVACRQGESALRALGTRSVRKGLAPPPPRGPRGIGGVEVAALPGTSANIGSNASRCFAPLATLAVKGVDREGRGHAFARLRRALGASFTR